MAMATHVEAIDRRNWDRSDFDRADFVRMIVVPMCVGFLFGWTSQAGAEPDRRLLSAVIWSALSVIGWLTNDIPTRMVATALRQRGTPLVVTLLAGYILAGPASIILNLTFGELFNLSGFQRNGLEMLRHLTLADMINSSFAPLALWLSINLIAFRMSGRLYGYNYPDLPEVAAPPLLPGTPVGRAAQTTQGLDFLRKVKPAVRGSVYAIKAELHYVRVYTDRGEDLIHYRFSDAVSEMETFAGLQVHRSWCVASDEIVTNSSRHVTLSNGMDIPVGRAYKASVRHGQSDIGRPNALTRRSS
jgi:hypothetical protein